MIPHCLVTAVSSLTLYQVVSAMNDDVRCSYKLVQRVQSRDQHLLAGQQGPDLMNVDL